MYVKFNITSKWEFRFGIGRDYCQMDYYWFPYKTRVRNGKLEWFDQHIRARTYNVLFGIFNMIKPPVSGTYLSTGKYKGFIKNFSFRVPIIKIKEY